MSTITHAPPQPTIIASQVVGAVAIKANQTKKTGAVTKKTIPSRVKH